MKIEISEHVSDDEVIKHAAIICEDNKFAIAQRSHEVLGENIGFSLVVTDGKRFGCTHGRITRDNMYYLYVGLDAVKNTIYENMISGNLRDIKNKLAKEK